MANAGKIAAPLDLVKLTPLMVQTRGRSDVLIGLIDGPVLMNHPELAREHIREIPGSVPGACSQASSAACRHGTFVAGILAGKRGSTAPAICPNCTLLVRPIFSEATPSNGQIPSAGPEELAAAIVDCMTAGARVINLSAALAQPSAKGYQELEEALDYAGGRNVITVAAAGNQGTIGSSAITRHPSVIPVIASDLEGRPSEESNLGSSIGKRGLSAPGDSITSLGVDGRSYTFGGTSAATPFVTGAIALLWSEFPTASAAAVRLAVVQTSARRRTTVVPPLLDAWAAYQSLAAAPVRG